MKDSGSNTLATMMPVLLTGGMMVGGYFLFKQGLLNPLLQEFGFQDSAADKKNKGADTPDSPWNPKYWHAWKNKMDKNELSPDVVKILIDRPSASSNIDIIYNALGRLNFDPFDLHLSDDDNKVVAVFKALHSKCAVSYLCERFQAAYSKDMFGFIQYYLNSDNMTKVNALVDALPVGLLDKDNNILK